MKTFFTLLAVVSVTLNLALIAMMPKRAVSEADPSQSLFVETKSATATTAPVIDDKVWEGLRSDELPTLLASLRAAGFPPHVVRAIMAAQLRERYSARMKALDPMAGIRPFWSSFSTDPKVQVASQALWREQQKALRELLGPEDSTTSMDSLYQRRRLDGIPSEKIGDVQDLLRDFDDRRNDIYMSAGGGIMGTEIQAKVAAMEKEQQAALAKMLTPQELEQYNLRNSETARSLRGQLIAFNPSEEEFLAIYKVQAEFDERVGRQMRMLGPAEMTKRMEAQKQTNEQIKAALGPARGAEYERANDFSYRQTSQLVARLEMPPETTTKIWEVQKEIQKRAGELYRSNPPPADRQKQLDELNTEAQAKVTAVLGARGFEAYKDYGGTWMGMLKPRTATGSRPGSIQVQPAPPR